MLSFNSDVEVMDSVSSTTFIKRPPCMTSIQKKFIHTKEILSGRIFLGCYQERRFVAVLKEYRDVVIISSEETELYHDIDVISQKWSGVKDIKWVGITGPDSVVMPKVYCFWVKLSNLAFGSYWFQIKHVKLLEGEIVLQFKCIRKSQTPLIAITSHVDQKPIPENKYEKGEAPTTKGLVWGFNVKEIFSAFQESCSRKTHCVWPFLTWKNIFYTLKVAFALIIALVMGIITLIGHLGEYTLKLIREFTLLVNAFTPIVVQLIDFLTKVVGGLYILIAGMFMRNTNEFNRNPFENQNLCSIPYSNAFKPPQALAVDWRERNRLLRQELFSTSYKRK